MPDPLYDFAKTLVRERVKRELPEELLDQMTSDLTERISDFMNERIIRCLPENKLAAFEAVLDAGGDTDAFLTDNISELHHLLGRILGEFRQIYLG